ncbi:hypothetical protein ACNQP7_31730 [Mycolicibacterium fortuitum]|uniref:hypothetical protein n=1 Tax=Mycolicibacterium fortuitum TaxID=1766 RepID=UPI003AAC333E
MSEPLTSNRDESDETPLAVGDLVLPVEFRPFERAFTHYNLRVTHVFKNGTVRAKTDSGHAKWQGLAQSFYRPAFTTETDYLEDK